MDKHTGKWYRVRHPLAEKLEDPEKNPNYPQHWAGLIGGPRFDDSFEEVESSSGYWDPDHGDFVSLEPCTMRVKHVNKGKTNENIYFMIEFDKPVFGQRTRTYNICTEGYAHSRSLALRHRPRKIYE